VDLVSKVRDSIAGVEGAPKFDLILTDVQMPLLDGLNATAQIRALEKNGGIIKHLPIVAVTAHAMTDETSRMRQFGVDDVVTKPLDPIRLGQVIQKLTGSEAAASLGTSKSGLGTTMAAGELSELVCRLWAQLARRDRDLSALFLLSDEPQNPEDLKKVLDISDVLERTGNSVRRTLLIFSGFLECFRDQIIKLSEAKQASNFEDLRFAAHALKGLLLDVGAKVAGDVASTVEQSCMSGQQAEALSLVGQLTKQVLAVSRLVTQICQVATGGLDSQEALNAVQSRDQQSPFN
jgi:CheY-like chemotaxis protein/HPt (histidine-containing phosphotransfer) domain-containing protein